MSDFNLSEKIIYGVEEDLVTKKPILVFIEDVKEFIKRLKQIEITKLRTHEFYDIVDKLAGEKLI